MKTQWHTELPEGERRPVWVTWSDGSVNWTESSDIERVVNIKSALAWAEYTPEKPEPYQPPKEPTAEEIEAWRDLEERVRRDGPWLSGEHAYHRIFDKLDAARASRGTK